MPVRVTNVTRERPLAWKAERAVTFWQRLVGLMGQRGLPEGGGLHIVPCNGIHSFFMRFPFDAVFVDRDLRVVHCVEAMVPWRATAVIRGSHSVLELPAGTVAASGTCAGDILRLDAEGR